MTTTSTLTPAKTRAALLDATIVVPTRNRSASLARTLESLCDATAGDHTFEVVVVDNDSSDDTSAVVQRYVDRLPIRYCFERVHGMASANNRAIAEARLGRLVVFTNDDVTMSPGWLETIINVSRRWPDVRLFGGRVLPAWPDGRQPRWAAQSGRTGLGLRGHDLGDGDRPYEPGQTPTGALHWMRRELLEEGHRFCPSMGVGAARRAAGCETDFLLRMLQRGERIVYVGQAAVWHHITAEELAPGSLRRRAARFGRTPPNLHGPCEAELLQRRPLTWRAKRYAALSWAVVRYLGGYLRPTRERRLAAMLTPLADLHYNIEALRIADERRHGMGIGGGAA